MIPILCFLLFLCNFSVSLSNPQKETRQASSRPVCQECNKPFASRFSLKRHRKTQHTPNPRRFLCVCNKFFSSAQSLKRHKLKGRCPSDPLLSQPQAVSAVPSQQQLQSATELACIPLLPCITIIPLLAVPLPASQGHMTPPRHLTQQELSTASSLLTLRHQDAIDPQ